MSSAFVTLGNRRLTPDQAYQIMGKLHEEGRLSEALTGYHAILAAAPTHAPTLVAAAYILSELKDNVAALDLANKAWAANPAYARTYYFFVYHLARAGNARAAIIWCNRGLEHHPTDATLLNALGRHQYTMQDYPAALATYTTILKHHPTSAEAQHMVAALSGQAVARASNSYVAEHFDSFAARFDNHLKGLGYRTPELITDLLIKTATPPAHGWVMADLGCGTGLCGPYLQPYKASLTGIDLSPAMLAQARSRGYNALVTDDLEHWLQSTPDASHDLLLSADTLVYLGDLTITFKESARVLKPGGWLAATSEDNPDTDTWQLKPSGRYGHTTTYLKNQCQIHGLTPVLLESHPLRKENGAMLTGHILLAQKPLDCQA